MNERLMRAAPSHFAEFITAFEAEEKTAKNKGPEPLWLIWQYEGDFTLWDLMQKKDFPYNLEQQLFGQELDMPKGPQRKAVTLSLVMQQVRAGMPQYPQQHNRSPSMRLSLLKSSLFSAKLITVMQKLVMHTYPGTLS